MSKLIQKEIKVTDGDVVFDIKMKNGLTIILGDSSSCKTYLYRLICKYSRLGMLNDIEYINADTGKKEFKGKGKIYVIDNADIFVG